MGVIIGYLIFCFATSIALCIIAYAPMLNQARSYGIRNALTENKWLSYVVYIVVTAAIAPIVFPVFFSDSYFDKFCKGMRTAVYEAD